MRPIKNVLFDADGVLWVGGKTIPAAPDAIQKLREMGLNVFVVTNNPTHTRQAIADKMMGRGFKNITKDMIVSAGYVTAQFLVSKGFTNQKRKVFVVGEKGLIQEMRDNGINAIGVDDLPDDPIENLKLDPSILACVVALDMTLTYRKLAIGNRVVVENDAMLIGTNCDNALPLGNGVFVPDAFPNILALENSSGRKAIVLGKPSPLMFEPLHTVRGLDVGETLMVGDRLNTDILFSKNIGSRGCLVLTGITTREDAMSVPVEERPNYICQSIGNIPELVEQVNAECEELKGSDYE
ncbi:haloacid dehalogenase-like hydrolase family protein [Trichomonas vaginalis G3]|uniref:Haloacid dehalogenase-like hydrolase family protein n=1 Tax=Trichomonas vaginalis (strain ATCC PRA-98 / G3) TaxID=412133 RepID=A2FUN7_TRIV3|nr:phosphoglycolate phosphatase protein [Trichomonas vaginalis G3]EAX91385.1 haloacid dehalogenase-like hydrolase family protein [Trichomonas vaginalis G3]KAI5483611.1 phosphoglycolate phosphatase protein [Trichomonas vaginalis G3]|eukprot:XP_001304315.1 haloacid dehalogenase-like hydrolase family protein [Trichomonas vaginalis G3]